MWLRRLVRPRVGINFQRWRHNTAKKERYQLVLNRSKSDNVTYRLQSGVLHRQHTPGLRRMLSDEVSKAQEAAKDASKSREEPTIFAKIINKEIPANIIHEDDKVLFNI